MQCFSTADSQSFDRTMTIISSTMARPATAGAATYYHHHAHSSRPRRYCWCTAIALLMACCCLLARRSAVAFTASRRPPARIGGVVSSLSRHLLLLSSSSSAAAAAAAASSSTNSTTDVSSLSSSSSSSPWNDPTLREKVAAKRRNNRARFRQHVNPLASKFQQPTELPENWPASSFDDCRTRPLHLDIGSAKGTFLLDLCEKEIISNSNSNYDKQQQQEQQQFNYLGLEIRPAVATFAQSRVAERGFTGRLEFLGCNVNVDLERLLTLYQQEYYYHSDDDNNDDNNKTPAACLQRVTIQFPDPHFKARNAKRRVVNPALIDTLAKFMPAQAQVILQSDVQCKCWSGGVKSDWIGLYVYIYT